MQRDGDLRTAPAVLILAGGEARRMGGEKPLRLLGGRSLLDRAIERAETWSDRVAVAARSVEQVGAPPVPVLIDAPGIEGPLAGLASAAWLDRPLVLTIPCDMPFLPQDLLLRLAAQLAGHGAALAASGERVHPVCGLWRTEALAEIRRYTASGRRSVMGFAEMIDCATVDWPGEAFVNVNTPLELAAAEGRLG